MPASRTLFIAAAVVILAGCGDARLKKLSTGIERDSVAAIMGSDAPHRAETYMTEGKFWEVLMFARDDAAAADSIAWRKLSPVVMADGKVVGWGWGYWEAEATKLNIALPPAD